MNPEAEENFMRESTNETRTLMLRMRGVVAPIHNVGKPLRRVALLHVVIFSFGILISAQTKVPAFSDYPVTSTFKGPNAPAVITRKDRMFKTRLREATRSQKPNFAGHYILTTWGCGSSCIMGAIIDAKTGRVFWWNFTVTDWVFDEDEKNLQPIEVRLNSRLIRFTGARNEKEGDVGTHFYKFDGNRFIHLKTILQKNPDLTGTS